MQKSCSVRALHAQKLARALMEYGLVRAYAPPVGGVLVYAFKGTITQSRLSAANHYMMKCSQNGGEYVVKGSEIQPQENPCVVFAATVVWQRDRGACL